MRPRRTEEIIFSSIYLTAVIASFVPYLIILYIIRRKTKDFGGTAYLIIFNLGIADCIQLVLHSFAFVFSLANTTFYPWLNKACGSILIGAFMVFNSCTLLLAFDRFIMLCLPTKIARVLDGPVMKFLLIIAWLNGLTYLILTLFPECSVIYWLENVGWEYTQENWCPLIDRLEFYLNVGQCLLGAIFYIIIIGNLVYLRKTLPTNFNNKYRAELNLLFQAIIIGGYVVVAEVVFHSAEVFIPDNMLASFLGNILWIGECGLTPYVYLMINTTLRNAFIEFVRCKKPHVTSVQRSWIT